MSKPDTVNFNTLEQVVSADLNRMGLLAGKGIMDRFLELVGGIDSAVAPRNVVARGLDLTPGGDARTELKGLVPLTMSVVVSAGELFRFEPAVVGDLSQYRLGALLANTHQTVNAADVNARIDLISVAEASVLTDTSTRNVLALPSRVVSPQNVDKTNQAGLAITYTAGTPAVQPTIPATPAGQVAIWAILVRAAALRLTDADFMDLRVPLNAYAFSRAHHMLERIACSAAAGISATSASFQTGRAVVNGAIVDNLTEKTFTGAELLEGVPGRIVVRGPQPNTQYHVYLVGKGSGDPVGKTVADGVIFVMSTTRPSEDGRPRAGITYRPFHTIGPHAIGPHAVQHTTWNALYVGSLTTDETGAFEPFGSGLPINRNGSATIAAASSFDGIFPAKIGFIKAPHFSWVSADSVRVGAYAAVVAGFPATYGPITATMGANLDSRERASTWYYVYLRLAQTSNGKLGAIRTHVVIISDEPPNEFGCKPTPQWTFNSFDYLYVGSFFNNSESDIEAFTKEGNHVLFRSGNLIFSRDLAVEPSRSTVTVPMPATSRMALLLFDSEILGVGPGDAVANYRIYSATGSTRYLCQITLRTDEVAADIEHISSVPGRPARNNASDHLGPFPLSLSDVAAFELSRTTHSGTSTSIYINVLVYQLGYIEDIHAPLGS